MTHVDRFFRTHFVAIMVCLLAVLAWGLAVIHLSGLWVRFLQECVPFMIGLGCLFAATCVLFALRAYQDSVDDVIEKYTAV